MASTIFTDALHDRQPGFFSVLETLNNLRPPVFVVARAYHRFRV
jgi:hypothetical protein